MPYVGHFQPGGVIGLLVAFLRDPRFLEELARVGNAAHLKAFELLRLKPLPDYELGAAAADIHYQARMLVVGERVGHTQVYQAGLLAAVNNAHGNAEQGFSRSGKVTPVVRLAQRVRADDTHTVRVDAVKHLLETRQAIHAAPHRRFVQHAVAEAGGQLDFLAERLDRSHFIVLKARDDQVKTVRTHVDGGQDGAVGDILPAGLGGLSYCAFLHWVVSADVHGVWRYGKA